MSISDDFYDVERALKSKKPPTQADKRAFERIRAVFNTMEQEQEELLALKSAVRTMISLSKVKT